MKTVFRKFFLLAPIALALAAVGTMSAQTTYTYTLNLPDISGITETDRSFFQYEFSWLGPLQFNAPDNSECPTGCPVSGTTPGVPAPGFSYGGVSFTSSVGADACSGSPSGGCSEVDLTYFGIQNTELPGNGNSIAESSIMFRLIEPDSFWANPGTMTFGPNSAGDSGVGASFLVNSGVPSVFRQADNEFACNECSVTVATTATPEPGTWMLLAGGLAIVGLVFGRRVLRSV